MISMYVTYVVVALLLTIMIYSADVHKTLKFCTLTVFILFGLVVDYHYRNSLGAPIENYPQGEFLYVHHENIGGDILIWAATEAKGDRLYRIPYDQDTAEELAEMQQQGNDQVGEFIQEEDDRFGNTDPAVVLERDEFVSENTEETKG